MELVFDWAAETVTVTFRNAETGSELVREIVPLNNGVDVRDVQLHGFTSDTLQFGTPALKTRSCVMQFSEITVTK